MDEEREQLCMLWESTKMTRQLMKSFGHLRLLCESFKNYMNIVEFLVPHSVNNRHLHHTSFLLRPWSRPQLLGPFSSWEGRVTVSVMVRVALGWTSWKGMLILPLWKDTRRVWVQHAYCQNNRKYTPKVYQISCPSFPVSYLMLKMMSFQNGAEAA